MLRANDISGPTPLRSDVSAVVKAHVAQAPRTGDYRDWQAYYDLKRVLSRTCGWGCPAGKYSQSEFDAGIQAYIAGVKL